MALSEEKLEEIREYARDSPIGSWIGTWVPELLAEVERLTFTLRAIEAHAGNSLPGGMLYSDGDAGEFLMDGGLRVIRTYATRAINGEDIRT